MYKETESHFKVIAVPEGEYWVDEEILNSTVPDSIMGVYLIDTSTVTYLCSPKPTYFALFLYTSVVALDDLPMEYRDRIYSLIDEGDAYSDDQYFGTTFAEAHVVHDEGKVDWSELGFESEIEYMEHLEEYFKANHVF